MKTRGQRKREQKAKLARSPREQRLKRRLARIETRKVHKQNNTHVAALMESYALRQMKKRDEARAAKAPPAPAAARAGKTAPVQSATRGGAASRGPKSAGGSR